MGKSQIGEDISCGIYLLNPSDYNLNFAGIVIRDTVNLIVHKIYEILDVKEFACIIEAQNYFFNKYKKRWCGEGCLVTLWVQLIFNEMKTPGKKAES